MSQPHIIHTDGGARGNPGPAAYAFVLSGPDGNVIDKESETLGNTTNNVAEYTAVVKALQHAKGLGIKKILLKSDSELMVKQMTGQYKVKNAGLLPLYQEAQALRHAFDEVKFQHVRREYNTEADRLCNEALDGMPTSSLPRSVSLPELHRSTAPAKEADPWKAARTEGLAILNEAAEAWKTGGDSPAVPYVWNELLDVLERHGLIDDEE